MPKPTSQVLNVAPVARHNGPSPASLASAVQVISGVATRIFHSGRVASTDQIKNTSAKSAKAASQPIKPNNSRPPWRGVEYASPITPTHDATSASYRGRNARR
jgi:hypothetical protein